ncbi:MAG: hypothetical protein CFE44_20085, partial [Burkholderiales bacterium PBB4]
MNHLKISTRLIFLVATLSFMLIAGAAMGLYGITKGNEGLRTVYEDNTVPLASLGKVLELTQRNILLVAISLTNVEPATITKNLAEVETNSAEITKEWAVYAAAAMTPEEAQYAKAFTEARADFLDKGLKPAVQALKESKIAEAQKLFTEAVEPGYLKVKESIKPLIEIQSKTAKSEYEIAVSRADLIRWIAVCSLALGLPIAALFSFYLISGLSRSLTRAIELAHA